MKAALWAVPLAALAASSRAAKSRDPADLQTAPGMLLEWPTRSNLLEHDSD